jgi:hypothetical protein
MKTSINQIKTTVYSTINRQDQAEKRISEMEDETKGMLHQDNQKISQLYVMI